MLVCMYACICASVNMHVKVCMVESIPLALYMDKPNVR